MPMLKKGKVELMVDEKGRISSLKLDGGRNVISAPVGMFRAVLKNGDNWEDVAWADEQTMSVHQEGDAIRICTETLKTRSGEKQIAVELTLRMDDEGKVNFSARIDNHSDSTVNDWIWPCVGMMDTLEGGVMDLLYPKHMGERVKNISEYLKSIGGREGARTMAHSYPGPLSMQWMMLEDGNTCLYFSGRDDLFYTSALRATASEQGGVTLEMNKLAFVKPGESWQCPDYLLWLYQGSWMEGAKEYAHWASGWRKPVTPKEWIRKMNGYFLVICKQQYGDEIWPYETIPELYDLARAHGFDTLGLFGWYHSGHDNRYPDLEVSPTLGGEDILKKNIDLVHEKGGHVTLYFQGHLIDVGTDFYRNKGRYLEGKTRWGTPYYEYYDKFCSSDYLRLFSKKPFATVCPTCGEWHEEMAKRADWIHGLHADGILYDQIGGMPPYPCFDESHHHLMDKPSLSHAQGRIRLHKRIRRQVDSHENFAYMTEHVTDVHSQFLDCIHGIGSLPGAKGTDMAVNGTAIHDVHSSGKADVGCTMMPEMFRYTFPDTLITIRNPNPFVSRRYANYATLYGFKLEMEVRYLTDQTFVRNDEGQEDRLYVGKIAAMREKLRKYLLEGRFEAQKGLGDRNPAVKTTVFTAEDGTQAVALWNDSDRAETVSVQLEGFQPDAWMNPDGQGDGVPGLIGPEELLVLYSRKNA